ncbi:malto-oligosyltrehalose trehalohydrolase [Aquibium carbonis]|uniref:malto-oligosyltrehalose trehalohydrolase n=1 Tax=Aquibium carbonis TaxID=2495581 RepID=UPI001FE0FC39|nr:malto-oligosyltrehalose trehalohydrolase [Aquibium carbonis]
MTGGRPPRALPPLSWGAEHTGDGAVRFRLWAPGLDALTLRLGGEDRPMTRGRNGWFEHVADGIAPGTAYAYVLPDGMAVPDPAARAQASDVHGPSLVVDPATHRWTAPDWTGRPWEQAVIYELHVGTFTEAGTFEAAIEKLDHLADLGVTAIELMPVGQFSGDRGWGYDGVLPYAPHRAYGGPDGLKALVDAAHQRGLMVLLDVVYNHFGPDGNYISLYAPDFFRAGKHTPWGPAIAFEAEPVRRFFVENALYWLAEYRLDGLRLDAVDHVADDLLVEIGRRVRETFPDRHIHLTTEDNRNVTFLHQRGETGTVPGFTAEWNDDFHSIAHVIATGETDGYFADFADDPAGKLARALAEGFAYQGEVSPQWGRPRGEPCAHLPPTAFVDFLQNHDQVGNRAFGERLPALASPDMLRVLTAMLLLSPHIPLLFMGEEFSEDRPFLFFTDFRGDLAKAVTEGRRREFATFAAFRDGEAARRIPDPNDPGTFLASKLDWTKPGLGRGRIRLDQIRRLLATRRETIAPLLASARGHSGTIRDAAEGVVAVDWRLGGARLSLRANLSGTTRSAPGLDAPVLFAEPAETMAVLADRVEMPPVSIVVGLAPQGEAATRAEG